MVGRETHAVHEHLSLIEWAEIAGLRIAEADHPEQPVRAGISDRDRVRELLGSVDTVAVAQRDVRRRGCIRGLSGPSGQRTDKEGTCEQACLETALHCVGLLFPRVL